MFRWLNVVLKCVGDVAKSATVSGVDTSCNVGLPCTCRCVGDAAKSATVVSMFDRTRTPCNSRMKIFYNLIQ